MTKNYFWMTKIFVPKKVYANKKIGSQKESIFNLKKRLVNEALRVWGPSI